MATNGAPTNGSTNGIANGHANGDSTAPVPPRLPEARPVEYAPGQTLLPPLSRRGEGPGLIVILPEEGSLEAPGRSFQCFKFGSLLYLDLGFRLSSKSRLL